MDGDDFPSDDPRFGQRFTDHMVVARFDARHGWTKNEIVPFGELSISPVAMVFHYGQSVFEGLKAYRQPDASVALFRPHDHAARFDRSARRLVMPELPRGAFIDACTGLVRADEGWVPCAPGHSLYLRPMLIATEAGLGVRPAGEYLFLIVASPAGCYFSAGRQSLTVWATPEYARAAPGGTGTAKCAGNYAASLAAQHQAAAHGCGETLWLDAVEHRWVEELSGMNIVLVTAGRTGPTLVAPPTGCTILDGVTRRSLLELASTMGYDVVERPVSLDELGDSRSFVEALACGTAAGVVPITSVRSASREWTIGDGRPGPTVMRLQHELIALQEGHADDAFGWRVRITGAALAEPSLPSHIQRRDDRT